ncbi:MAG: T9SS type A sorting domain-containing protein [Bacteroidota bacterium]
MKIRFICPLFLLFCYPGFSQPYEPLVQDYAYWKVKRFSSYLFSVSYDVAENFICGDTILDSVSVYRPLGEPDSVQYDVLYKQLWEYRDNSHLDTLDPPPASYLFLRALIREDTARRKSYIVNMLEDSILLKEKLLYDFSLQIGDTLFHEENFTGPIVDYYVDTIYYDTVWAKMRRHLVLYKAQSVGLYPPTYLQIEGIGAEFGFIERIPSSTAGESFYSDLIDYQLQDEAACQAFLNRSTDGIQADEIIEWEIYPNPVHTLLHVHLPPDRSWKHARLSLVDPLGRSLRTWALEHARNSLNLEAIPKGYYFLILKERGSILTRAAILIRS